tara:strand:- start:949 stop:1143 length:195 start_codon:yes stop_codon:yes gene_type:complete
MDWKTLTKDIKLFNELIDRFVEIGCTEDKAFELATYVYAYNLPVVIRTSKISTDDNKRYNTDKL